MSEDRDEDLEPIETDRLIAELCRRHDGTVFAGLMDKEKTPEGARGSLVASMSGCPRIRSYLMTYLTSQLFQEAIDDGEDE